MSSVDKKDKSKDIETNNNNDNDDSKNNNKNNDSSSSSSMPVSTTMKGGAIVTKGSSTYASSFKLLLLVLMVLQNTSTVLVGRHTRSSVTAEELYVVNHLILITESMKFFLSCLLEHVHGGNLIRSIRRHVIETPGDAFKMSVPSLLYLVQNSLLYTALSNLSAPLFQVTYQAKLVTTALVSVVMLQRSYTTQQWICLVTISFGVAIVVLGEQQHQHHEENSKTSSANNGTSGGGEDDDKPHQSLTLGLTAVTIACFSSALAGVYFEKVLKHTTTPKTTTTTNGGTLLSSAQQPTQPSLWMRNIELAFFSVLFAIVQNWGSSHSSATNDGGDNGDSSKTSSYLHGFTGWVWVLVGLQAGGGLLVAAVIKYADNVLKGLATGVSVVVATLCSMALFGTPLSAQFTFGATLILNSVYLFSNKVPSSCGRVVGSSSTVEMKPLVLPK